MLFREATDVSELPFEYLVAGAKAGNEELGLELVCRVVEGVNTGSVLKEWDESLHPRDEHGRFSDMAGISLMHADKIAEKIEKLDKDIQGAFDNVANEEDRQRLIALMKERTILARLNPISERRAYLVSTSNKSYKYIAENYPEAVARGMTEKEVRAETAEKLQKFVDENPVAVRVPFSKVNSILDDGLQNFYETGRRGGLRGEFYQTERAYAEEVLLGIGSEKSNDDHPVYGYVRTPSDDPDHFDCVGPYGNTDIILKDSVKDRSTITLDDSLDSHYANQPVLPSPARAVESYSVYGLRAEQMLDAGKDAPITKIPFSYVEAQIHGDVKSSDIESIIFPKKPTKALVAKMDALGIEYTVEEDN